MRCAGPGGAPASPSAPSSDQPDDKPTCLTQRPPDGVVESSGAGWIYYAPTGSHKRATAATACLKNPVGKGSDSNSNSPGMDAARKRAKALYPNADVGKLVNSCHLIPKALGGRGIQRNLTPCWATPVNVGAMTRIQSSVTGFLSKGGIVKLMVLAKYKDHGVIPYAFTFSITAWDSRGNPYPLAVPGAGMVQNVKDGHYLNP